MPLSTEILEACDDIAAQIVRGRVVPFFGAAVNLADRDPAEVFERGRNLPSGGELAQFLAGKFRYPVAYRNLECTHCRTPMNVPEPFDLLRVAQFIATKSDEGTLYDELHELFVTGAYQPSSVHRFFAQLPARLRAAGSQSSYPVIVTTNYDDLMERAFDAVSPPQPYDVISYESKRGGMQGYFWHRKSDGSREVIRTPNEYTGLPLNRRPIILKVHGAICRENRNDDAYVITEDHYADYRLAVGQRQSTIPVMLLQHLQNSHILFLGYGLRDWNLRMVLRRIWEEQPIARRSWSVQYQVDELERLFWQARNVRLFDVPLKEYMRTLAEALEKRL